MEEEKNGTVETEYEKPEPSENTPEPSENTPEHAENTPVQSEDTPKQPDSSGGAGKKRIVPLIAVICACALLLGVIAFCIVKLTGKGPVVPVDAEQQDTVTQQEQLPLPDTSVFRNTYVKSPQNSAAHDRSVIVIQLQSLGIGVIGSSYEGVEITPNINALARTGMSFNENVSSSKSSASVEFVMNNSLTAPKNDDALTSYKDDVLYGLPGALASAGYTSIGVAGGSGDYYSRAEAYANMGFTRFIASGSDSVYTKAADEIRAADGKFYMYITDPTTSFPYTYGGEGELGADIIGKSTTVASYIKAVNAADARIGELISELKAKGSFENTVIVITGSGYPITPSNSADLAAMKTVYPDFNSSSAKKTPLLISSPSFEQSEYTVRTTHSDFMPTLLDLLGIEDRDALFVGENMLCKTEDSAETYIEDCELALQSGLFAKVKESGAAEAVAAFEENKKNMSTDANRSTADKLPAYVGEDFYYSDVKLFHRATAVFANEFNGAYNSVIYKNNGITLIPGTKAGCFISEDIDTGGKFSSMTASWDCVTNGGVVELSVQCRKDDGSYTGWYSWGKWSSTSGVSGSSSTSDGDGGIDIDILTLKKQCAGVIRFRAELTASSSGDSPVLYSVYFATNKASGSLKAPLDEGASMDLPQRYQADVPRIGGSICSATSTSMVLEYLGETDLETETAGYAVYDNNAEIFGNWSYAVAFAAERGYNAFFDYYDLDALKYALSKGTPVVCSVRITAGQLSGSGYPDRATTGHLLVVTGYELVDGVEWVMINDPALRECKIKLLSSEFNTIWRNGAAYIIQPKPERFTWRIGEGTEQDIVVVADYIPKTQSNRRYGTEPGVKFITIHNTDNYRAGADAKAHAEYLKNTNDKLSWHFTVDENAIFKHIPEEEAAYHAGDGGQGKGNMYGIGIEICLNKQPAGTKPTAAFKKAVENAAQLTAELMIKYDLSIRAVQQHNYFSGKNCPSAMRENDMWDDFIASVTARYEALRSAAE